MFLSSVILVVACSTANRDERYFPLKSGLKWTYKVVSNQPPSFLIHKKGKVTKQRFSGTEWIRVIQIEGNETINEKKYMKNVRTIIGLPGMDPYIQYVRISQDGYYKLGNKYAEYLTIPFPIPDKKTWEVFDPHVGFNVKRRAEKVDKVYVAGKVYEDGLVITSEFQVNEDNINSDFEETEYFVANTGLVRSVSYNKTAGLTAESTLVEIAK